MTDDVPLADRVHNAQWLHNRATIRIPLGPNRLEVLIKARDQRLCQFNMTKVHEMGAQPLVLSPLPPLIRLLFAGCEQCDACRRKAARPLQCLQRNFINALEAICIYVALLQTDALHTAGVTSDAFARPGATRAMQALTSVYYETLRHNGLTDDANSDTVPQVLRDAWQAVDTALQSDGDVDLQPIATLAAAMDPGYTVELLHQLEAAVWASICSTAPAGERTALTTQTIISTPLSSVRERTWSTDSADDVDQWLRLQEQALDMVMCGRNAPTLVQWPSRRLPTWDQLRTLPDDVRARCYTVLAFYYGWLQATRTPERALSPLGQRETVTNLDDIKTPLLVGKPAGQ